MDGPGAINLITDEEARICAQQNLGSPEVELRFFPCLKLFRLACPELFSCPYYVYL